MKGSTVSRRVREFVGVALFAAALIWLIALATYEPGDPVWFFSTGLHGAPANFAGRVGAFLAELSFQLVGYAAYLIPAFFVITGWHYFWCSDVDAAGTKVTGGVLLFTFDAVGTRALWEADELGAAADPATARASMDRLRAVASQTGAQVVCGHDLEQWAALRHPPAKAGFPPHSRTSTSQVWPAHGALPDGRLRETVSCWTYSPAVRPTSRIRSLRPVWTQAPR